VQAGTGAEEQSGADRATHGDHLHLAVLQAVLVAGVLDRDQIGP